MSRRLLFHRLRSARLLSVVPCSSSASTSAALSVISCTSNRASCLPEGSNNISTSPWGSCWHCAALRGFITSSASWVTNSPATAVGSIVSFPLAQTGEGISECELMQWFVKEGDVVEEFQPICEVQSDKAAIEITSRHAGTVVKVHHAQGDVVKVGAPLVDIQLTAEAAAAAAGATDAPPAAAGSTDHSSTSSDTNPADGSDSSSAASSVRAAPTVRRLARELGVDLAKVHGSGPSGRILKEDVEKFKAGLVSHIADKLVDRIAARSAPTSTAEMYAAAAEPRFEGEQQAAGTGGVRRVADDAGSSVGGPAGVAGIAAGPQTTTRIPVRGYRRAMIKSSTEAAAIPTFHYMDEVHVDGLLAVRQLLKNDPLLQGTKLTYLPFIVKALSISLTKYPGLNCSLEPGGQTLLQHHSHNIGVAMATANGLVVPNVKQVENRSIPEIAHELARLQHLAAAGKLSTEDVTHGSMTISNIGTVGGTNATPMLNPPEAAIVALGRVQALPRFDHTGEHVIKRHIMSVSWGGDHRVIDGAAIAEFSNYWKHLLEEPSRLLMHLR